MYTIRFPEECDLATADPASLFTEETLKVPVSAQLCRHIQQVSRKADMLVLWTDMTADGDNVCFEVIDNVRQHLPSPADDYIFRAKYASLASKDISDALDNLVHRPNEHESLALDALRTIDLKIKSAFSAFLSRLLVEKFPTLEAVARSVEYDSCGTTALALCVERAEKLKKFAPEQYFSINILIKQTRTGFKTLELKWQRNKMYSRLHAMTVFEELK